MSGERVLRFMADASHTDAGAYLAAFRAYLLLHVAVREILAALHGAALGRVAGIGVLLLAVALDRSKSAWGVRTGLWIATLYWFGKLLFSFPSSANHLYLECLALVVCLCGASSRARVDDLELASLRWLPLIVSFHAALQKVLHGTYFNGSFLASQLHKDGFGAVFAAILPQPEHATLVGLARAGAAGPYRFESAAGLLASNLAWSCELAIAVLLLWPRSRKLGAVLGVVSLIGIEAAARELCFGLLMLALLALHLPLGTARGVLVAATRCLPLLIALQLAVGAELRVFN